MKPTYIAGLLLITAVCMAVAGPRNPRTLDELEATHLTFMRSEEKLARDVYLTFAEMYQGVAGAEVFTNIGDGSEQTHTDAVRDMLEAYGLEDPNPEANTLPESIGVFTGGEYAGYFEGKYLDLVYAGKVDLLSALYVGAFIEELDMNDIIICPKVMEENEVGVPEIGCGLNYTDEKSLKTLYTHLVEGSENHLRAFVKQIEKITGKPYEAQYLSQEQVDEILGR